MFLASCCVRVEPPCADAAVHHVGGGGAKDAERIDAHVRIEAPVLDGDEGLRQMRGQVLERDVGAGHLAAGGEDAAVEAGDLDGRRPLRYGKRLDRRQMRADPDDHADRGDHAPQSKHRAPVEDIAEEAASVPRLLALAFGGGLLARLRLVVVVGLALAHRCRRLALVRRCDPVIAGEPQVGQRTGEAKPRFRPRSFLSPTPEHTQTNPALRPIAAR